MFACEHEQVSPDMMALAKGITGGYMPLAATLTTQSIYNAFLGDYAEFKTFFHGHSYTGNPLGAAAGIANLAVFEKELVLKKMAPRIQSLKKMLKPLKKRPHVGEIRQIGMIVGIELVADQKTKAPYPLEQRIGKQICDEAKKKGVLLRPLGNVIVLMPPLSIPLRDLQKLVRIVGSVIQKVTEQSVGTI